MTPDVVIARPGMRRYVWVAVLVGVIVLFAGGATIAASPAACGTCHLMDANVQGWEDAPHRDISCHACHAGPGIGGRITMMQDGIRGLYVNLTDRPEPHQVSGSVPVERCVACHEESWMDPAFAGTHPGPEARCSVCHRETYHLNPRMIYPEIGVAAREVSYGEEVTCAECHTSRQMLRSDIIADPREQASVAVEGTGEG